MYTLKDKHKKRRRKGWYKPYLKAIGAMLLLVVFCLVGMTPYRKRLPALAVPTREEGEMRLHFLSVGEGDCTIVEYPNGNLLIVDGGDGSWENKNHIARYLKALSYGKIELLVTHADIDHYGGCADLLNLFPIETVYLPIVGSDNSKYLELLAAVETSACTQKTMTRYQTIEEAGASVFCLSPYSIEEEDNNDSSTVLYVSFGGINTVLCGDITSTREAKLLEEYTLDATILDRNGKVRLEDTDILKVAHHGSASSSSEDWLALLHPETAIISSGAGNQYRLPAESTLTALAAIGTEIYRTDELGDIIVTIRDGSYSVMSL